MELNSTIRDTIREAGLKQWQVADACGVSEGTFIRLLRHELPAEKRDKILQIIQELQQGREGK